MYNVCFAMKLERGRETERERERERGGGREGGNRVWEAMTYTKCHWQSPGTLLPNTTSNKISVRDNNTRVRTVINVYGNVSQNPHKWTALRTKASKKIQKPHPVTTRQKKIQATLYTTSTCMYTYCTRIYTTLCTFAILES